jgi:hypothetical protein
MTVGPIRNLSTNGARPARAPRGAGFALPTRDGPPDAAEVAAPSQAGLGGLLGLQEQPEPPESRTRRQVRATLHELAGLQAELLGGAIDPGRLHRLMALTEAEAAHAPPALQPLLAEVRLRARVELARRKPRTDV